MRGWGRLAKCKTYDPMLHVKFGEGASIGGDKRRRFFIFKVKNCRVNMYIEVIPLCKFILPL
jgi:hypothetical protein